MDELTRERYGPAVPWRELRQPPPRRRPAKPATPAEIEQRRAILNAALGPHRRNDDHDEKWTAA